jgi:hypothetical protein
VAVTSEYGIHAHVDEGIAGLIEACWAFGIGSRRGLIVAVHRSRRERRSG